MGPITAATKWASNAELIQAVADLGYISYDDEILDPTYGRGIWWKKFNAPRLHAYSDDFDFRNMPFDDETFDVVAYDPPYVATGGRRSSTIPGFNSRYGLVETPKSPALLQELMNEGLSECRRVVKDGGIVLMKCQDYVSSGKLWLGTHHSLTHALSIGLEVVDRLEHLSGVRPQPPKRRQIHARRNLSTLFVFRRHG